MGSCDTISWDVPSCGLCFLYPTAWRGKEMRSNAWQYSVCKCVKKRGRKRHPQILCNVPGGTQCCRAHTWWLHRKGKWRWWMDEAMPAHLCTSPTSLEVVPAQSRRWSGSWNSLLSSFSPLIEKIKRFCFFLCHPLLLRMLEKSMWK